MVTKKATSLGAELPPLVPLPEQGLPAEDIFDHFQSIRFDRVRGHWSTVFRATDDVQEIGRKAYQMFLSDNGIFSLYMPYMKAIEQDVMGMCASLFQSPDHAAANMTSGGSESIYCAIHAAREWAKETKPHITKPNIVSPYSGHATLTKACHYLGVELKRTPLRADMRADVDAMRAAIDDNTIGLYASAPCWSYALIDPVEEIGALATERDLWLHVDACIGGYILPHMEALGHSLPQWDFRVPGVKSISADLHKYGYCPKPASTVIWRDASLQKYHYVQVTLDDWPTGPYVTTGFLGSRSAGPIFAAWAVMKYLGRSGYEKLAAGVLETRRRLVEGVNAIPELAVMPCDAFPLPIGRSPDGTIDMALLAEGMKQRGWILLGTHQPPLINVPIDPAVTDEVIETFLKELRDTVADIQSGKLTGDGELRYG